MQQAVRASALVPRGFVVNDTTNDDGGMDNTVMWTHQGRGRARPTLRKASSRVSPLNTGEQYERFCHTVELVAACMGAGWTPDAAELALMSSGGRQPARWRAHVVRHRLLSLGG